MSLVLLHTLIIVLGPCQPHCYSDCSTGAVVLPSARMRSEGYSTWSVCLCVSLSVH